MHIQTIKNTACITWALGDRIDDHMINELSGMPPGGLVLEIEGRTFHMGVVEFTKKESRRFERGTVWQIRASTRDHTILSLLPNAMLGPTAEPADVVIRAAEESGREEDVRIHAHITNSMEGRSVEVGLVVVGTERA